MPLPQNNWPAATGYRIGLSGAVQFTTTVVGQTLHIPCKRGDHVVDFPIPGHCSPDVVAKRMIQAGWTVGSKLLCPEHSRRKRKDKPMATAPLSGQESKPMSDAAKKATRLVMMALEDYYDEAAKRYRPDWSDTKIAEQTGASEARVKSIREEFYGPLGQPPEIDALRVELAALVAAEKAHHDNMTQQIRNATSRIERICQMNGWPA